MLVSTTEYPGDGTHRHQRTRDAAMPCLVSADIRCGLFGADAGRTEGTRTQPIVRSPVSMSRLLVGVGVIILLIGITWPWLSRLGLGRLPGDIVIERENFHFYFPLATSIIFSIILSAVLWLLSR